MPRPALLFDIGNVLLRFDFRVAAQRFSELSDASATDVLGLMSPFKEDLESGAIDDATFTQLATERIGFRGSVEQFAHIWGDIFEANEPMVAHLDELVSLHPCYLFSNTNGLHKDFFMQRFPFFAKFAGGIFSHEARAMKPHEPIYRHAIEKFDLDPAQTFYIDDLADNIATGQRLGFQSYQYDFNRHEAFEAALRDWLARHR